VEIAEQFARGYREGEATYWQLGAVGTGLLSVYSLTKFLRRRLWTLVGNGR
jgi:hypothetical protein